MARAACSPEDASAVRGGVPPGCWVASLDGRLLDYSGLGRLLLRQALPEPGPDVYGQLGSVLTVISTSVRTSAGRRLPRSRTSSSAIGSCGSVTAVVGQASYQTPRRV